MTSDTPVPAFRWQEAIDLPGCERQKRSTPLQGAVQLLRRSPHQWVCRVVDDSWRLNRGAQRAELMVKEGGFDAGPYVMLLDAVILSAQTPRLGQAGAPVLGRHGAEN